MLQPSRRARWIGLAAFAFLCVGIVVFAQRVQAQAPQTDAQAALAAAFAAKDDSTLASTAAPEINVVRWMGDRRTLSAANALAELQADFLDPAAAPYIDRTSNLEAWFGIPPTSLWQDAISVGSVIFVRGLGADGAGDALVAVADGAQNPAHWNGLLLAENGFGLAAARDANPQTTKGAAVPEPSTSAPASSVNAADATEIDVLRAVNVYPAPDSSTVPVGLMRRNQTLPVVGVSGDGEYFQISCPRRVEGECWVANDPESVAAVGPEDPIVAEMQPTLEPEAAVDASASAVAAPAVAAVAEVQPTLAPELAVAASTTAGTPERISFLPGEVSANRTGVVEPAAPVSYILRILAGQALTVDLVSGGDAANFSVTGAANGQPYKAMSNPALNWTFTVPVTQDYIIRLESTVPTQYSLTVVAPPLAAPPASTPTAVAVERISFGAGETAATRSGSLAAGQSKEYLVRVLQGQQVTTELYTTGSANYSIVGANGTTVKRSDAGANPFTFIAPATQDYRVRIVASTATNYDFIVTIPPLSSAPTATPVAAVRLRVPPGGTSVSVADIVDAYGRDPYLVAAAAGQTMYVSLQSANNIVNFSIVGMSDGQPLKRVENESRTWSGTLPATQDYLITVVNPSGVRVQYTLFVQFSPLQGNAPTPTAQPSGPPQRIVFPAGGTTATVTGSAPQGYVLRALAGQTMSVRLYPQGNSTFSVAGSDGTVLKSSGAGGLGWSGVLPSNQDYTITVIPVSGSTAFALVVTVVF